MKPNFVFHTQYQESVIDRLGKHYNGGILVIRNSDWPLITKMWITDLSHITSMLRNEYSVSGPFPRDPASMFRSYLVFLITNPGIGITQWVEELHRVPLYAIISGFEPGDIPGVGTFYDFFQRLWASDKKNQRSEKQKRKKNGKKGKKKGEKAPTTTPGKVYRLARFMTRESAHKVNLPTDRLFDFFQTQILAVSAELGLLGDIHSLSVAGDGTPVVTAAYPRSKSTCTCHAQGLTECNHVRIYSQPDCNSGWDSSREKFFAGYHLYMLSASDSAYDLPLYPKLQPASRHDAPSFVISAVEFQQRFTLGTVDRMLLDSAHDAQAIYELLDKQGVEPFIDLNKRKTKKLTIKGEIQLSSSGVPVCPQGLEMNSNGYDNRKKRRQWRCPLASGTTITCPNPCSNAKYGRTYKTKSKDDLRLFPRILRDSAEWKEVYKRRWLGFPLPN